MLIDSATGLTPATAILAFSGWLLVSLQQQPITMVFLGSTIAAIGGSLGASLVYWMARLGGRTMMDGLMRKLRIKPQTILRVEQQFHKYGTLLIMVGRFLPGARQLVSVPAGLARMPYWKFIISTTVGSFIWSLVYISGGYYLGEEWPKFSQQIGVAAPYLLAVGLVGASIILGKWLWSRYRIQSVLKN